MFKENYFKAKRLLDDINRIQTYINNIDKRLHTENPNRSNLFVSDMFDNITVIPEDLQGPLLCLIKGELIAKREKLEKEFNQL